MKRQEQSECAGLFAQAEGSRNVRSHLPTVSRASGAEPDRTLPMSTGLGRAGQTAPHRTGPLCSPLHLPAVTRTLKEEENVARACAYFAQSRSKGGAPFGVSELISNSCVGLGSGWLPQVRFRA